MDGHAVQDRGPAVLAVTATTIAVASAFVALRFTSRIGIVKKVSLDDYFMIAAWVCSLFSPSSHSDSMYLSSCSKVRTSLQRINNLPDHRLWPIIRYMLRHQIWTRQA